MITVYCDGSDVTSAFVIVDPSKDLYIGSGVSVLNVNNNHQAEATAIRNSLQYLLDNVSNIQNEGVTVFTDWLNIIHLYPKQDVPSIIKEIQILSERIGSVNFVKVKHHTNSLNINQLCHTMAKCYRRLK